MNEINNKFNNNQIKAGEMPTSETVLMDLVERTKPQNNNQPNNLNNKPKEFIKKIIDTNISNMDDNNKKAAEKIQEGLKTGDMTGAIEHMFKHPKNGRPLSYAEMRYFYG